MLFGPRQPFSFARSTFRVMPAPCPGRERFGARLALRGDMQPGLKPPPVFPGRRFSRSILEFKSHSRTVLYSLHGNKPDGLRGRIFGFSNISTKLTGRLKACILQPELKFPKKFSGHFG